MQELTATAFAAHVGGGEVVGLEDAGGWARIRVAVSVEVLDGLP